MRRRTGGWTGGALLAAALLSAGIGATSTPARFGPPLLSAGVAGVAFGPDAHRVALPADATGEYLPGTNLLADTNLLIEAAGRTDEAAARTRAWLAEGIVPGRTEPERTLATRALLDLAMLTGPDGASVASPFGPWNLVWPRDASWHAAAFAATGHPAQAHAVVRFLARVQSPDGTWASRYFPDGSPVADGRASQLDAVGWVPWAIWSWWRADPRRVAGDTAALRELWPALQRAADVAVGALTAGGLPRPSSDYWEQRETRPTIGIAGPLLLGLRAAAALAADLDEATAAQRWSAAATRLDAAVARDFGGSGFRRYPEAGAGPDSAVTFLAALAPPRDVGDSLVRAVHRAERELLMPSGGLRPGNIPRVGDVAWTPATALFALAAASRGDEVAFGRWFWFLAQHRTALGALPEKVANNGAPASVAPLGWTCAIVVLALLAREGGLPVPPG